MDEQVLTLEIKPAEASQLEVLEHDFLLRRGQNVITSAMRSRSKGKESTSSPGMSIPQLVTSCYGGAAPRIHRS
jgi:hypothetical protein